MSRSTAALIIAVLFHLLILVLFLLLGYIFVTEPVEPKLQEHRIKIALKERPKAKENAALPNKRPPAEKIPPMPKGKQLEKLPQSQPLPTPRQQLPVAQPTPVKPQQKIPTPTKIAEPQAPVAKMQPVPPEKPYIPFMKTPEPKTAEANATEVPTEHKNLFAKLSQKQKNVERKAAAMSASARRESRIPNDIREAYGDAFGKLSAGEQKYLLDNQEIMRRLTQTQLNDTGSTMIPNNMRVNDYNIVEFYLHPDGRMTDFRTIRNSGFFLLDEVTKETIESVYWKYPRPEQKTLVRYKFGYYLRGY
ncbi:energy transducer TonB [Thiomicrolovo sp. ZZH C-3]